MRLGLELFQEHDGSISHFFNIGELLAVALLVGIQALTEDDMLRCLRE